MATNYLCPSVAELITDPDALNNKSCNWSESGNSSSLTLTSSQPSPRLPWAQLYLLDIIIPSSPVQAKDIMPLKVISLIALIFFLLVLYGEVREIFVLSCLSDYTTSQTEGGAGQSPLDARGGETGRPLSLSSGLISRSEPARQSISQDPAVSFMISCFGIFLSYCHCLYRGQS